MIENIKNFFLDIDPLDVALCTLLIVVIFVFGLGISAIVSDSKLLKECTSYGYSDTLMVYRHNRDTHYCTRTVNNTEYVIQVDNAENYDFGEIK